MEHFDRNHFEDIDSGRGKPEEMEVSWGIGTFSPEVLNHFHIGNVLGLGSFGWVHSAVYKATGTKVAIKSQMESFCAEEIGKEFEALRSLASHPNVIRMHMVMRDEESEQVSFVLDLMDLSLEDAVNRMTSQGLRFLENEVKSIWLQCLRGLRHIHTAGFLHCDLGARNILVDRTGTVKIADFSLAVRQEESVLHSKREDLLDLSVVFVYIVTQETVSDLGGLENKVSSAGVELVEEMFFGEVTAQRALSSRYFVERPSPQRPQIGQVLCVNPKDAEESMEFG
ncbi:mitogen-activated protein kinase 15-like [Oratosquilla oratoria]|uniref:mitogen-activated protein kinase 15-like n=1 Tax=Oratosquilla oratoria TaxID=337810 RepID=UPI003F76FAC0